MNTRVALGVIPSRVDGEGPRNRSEDLLPLYDDQSQSGRLVYGRNEQPRVRMWFDRNTSTKSFTKNCKVDRLVYYEQFNDARHAIAREKEMKGRRGRRKTIWCEALTPNGRIYDENCAIRIAESNKT